MGRVTRRQDDHPIARLDVGDEKQAQGLVETARDQHAVGIDAIEFGCDPLAKLDRRITLRIVQTQTRERFGGAGFQSEKLLLAHRLRGRRAEFVARPQGRGAVKKLLQGLAWRIGHGRN